MLSFCEKCHHRHCDTVKLGEIYENVKNSAYKIIEAKGATYYAIADAVRRIVSAIIRDEKTILTLSVAVNGEYGLSDMCIGLPCLVGKDGVEKILEIPLNDDERQRLDESAASLKKIIKEIESN